MINQNDYIVTAPDGEVHISYEIFSLFPRNPAGMKLTALFRFLFEAYLPEQNGIVGKIREADSIPGINDLLEVIKRTKTTKAGKLQFSDSDKKLIDELVGSIVGEIL